MDGQGERFTTENDYEGGVWIAGEFYAEGPKHKKRKQSKESQIYGIWADESDDDGFSGRGGKGEGRKGRGVLAGNAPTFVTEDNDKDDDAGNSGENDDVDANEEGEQEVRGGLGSSGRAGIGGGKQQQQRHQQQQQQPQQQQQQQQARAHQPITSNAAFAASLYQRSKWGGGAGGIGHKNEEEDVPRDDEVEGMQRDAFDEPHEQARGGLGGIGLGGKQQQQQQYAGVDPEVAKNLKNLLPGNNKIFKMLEKMGFKNRLGKNEDGLATALAPTMLEAGSGLGYSQKNLQSAKEAKKKNDIAKAAKAADGPVKREESTGWMKGAKKVEVKYVTAQERKEQAAASGSSSSNVIFDMRGPSARILQTEQLRSDSHSLNDGPFPELEHNMAHIVEMAAAEVNDLGQRGGRESEQVAAAQAALDRARRSLEEEERRLNRVQTVCDMLQAAAAAVAKGSCSVDDLLDTVTVLRIEYAAEWDALGLYAAAALLVTPAFHSFLQQQWDVLHDAAQHSQSMEAWKVLLTPDDASSCPLPPQEIRAIFNGLLMRSVVPVACAQLKKWDVRLQHSAALTLMHHWQSVLTDTSASFILDNGILPRVIAAAEDWDPQTDPQPLDEWLLPILPVLGSRADAILPIVRLKLVAALQQWTPSDTSAVAVVKPWIRVFEPLHARYLLESCIIPKLSAAISHMQINPAAQDTQPIMWLLAWHGVIPVPLIARVLETSFFIRWLSVLVAWLRASPNYAEVGAWYSQWKALLPADVLENGTTQHFMTRALTLISMHVQGNHNIDLTAALAPAPAVSSTGMWQHVGREAAGRPTHAVVANAAPAKKQPPPPPDNEPSFLEQVVDFAARNSVVFLPKADGHSVGGKRVYTFGKHSVYLDHNVVHALQPGGSWAPVHLESLIS